ncbi:hypothetical protein F5882DRAFT_388394 [Hyaloscypha sp. PMI_1271]|nr:hypothetical protein F5882DRAFT_388394 [Hyaloscypha sp. PMI_1271]
MRGLSFSALTCLSGSLMLATTCSSRRVRLPAPSQSQALSGDKENQLLPMKTTRTPISNQQRNPSHLLMTFTTRTVIPFSPLSRPRCLHILAR